MSEKIKDMKANILRLLSENAELKRERDEARKVLLEIANASHFDNIGNWARNKAKQALKIK
jgi:regulator of replication initiation timing